MKLVRFGPIGAERPGLIDAAGALRSLAGVIDDLDTAAIAPAGLARLAGLDTAALPQVSGPVRYGVPVAGSAKFVCIGLNYRDHAAEAGMAIPDEPVIFQKAITALGGPDDDILLPPGAGKLDWEIELGVVIGSRARHIGRAAALAHVAGYVIVNDISERTWQLERGGTWDKGKSHDSFGPVGPWLVTIDEIADPQDLVLFLDVNGVRMQTGTTAQMIFDVPALVAYVSQFMTLMPGDIIATGTPPGVGMGKTPARFLGAGDRLHLGISGLGDQRQLVVPMMLPQGGAGSGPGAGAAA